MAVEERDGVTQLWSPQHVQIVVTAFVRVRAEDASAKGAAERVERVHILSVHADLKGRLVHMCREDSQTNDEADAEAEVEFTHSANILCFQMETIACGTWHILISQLPSGAAGG